MIKNEKKYILQTYKRNPLLIVKGKDKFVWDDTGKKYLDMFSGLSVCNVGHSNPKVVSAITEQAKKYLHTSNLYYTEPQIKLAQQLIGLSFPGKVFFSNSGAEANECAIKASRRMGQGRYEIIAFNESFHGRTMGTISATGQEKFHKGFHPLLPGFVFADFNDLDSVKRLINKKTAAILVEPVQGEGGVNVGTKTFLKGLRQLADKHNLTLIFDEVQTGLGRTGKIFAFEHSSVKPDIVTLAKSLGGGLPIGATILSKKCENALGAGDHASTFGGNPVSCAAALAVLSLLDKKMLKHVQQLGEYFLEQLAGLIAKYPFVKSARGTGLMIGLELDFPGAGIVDYFRQQGVLINCTHNTVLRFLPPFTITRADVDLTVKLLDKAFKLHADNKL